MEKAYKPFTTSVLAVAGWISSRMGILAPLMIAFIMVMAIDYGSGMAAAAVESMEHPDDEKYGWKKSVGIIGIIKKTSYIILIAACMIADYVIMLGTQVMGWENPVKGVFAVFITLYLIFNEILSIIENVKRCGAPVPEWAIKYIAVMKNGINNKFDYMEDKRKEE